MLYAMARMVATSSVIEIERTSGGGPVPTIKTYHRYVYLGPLKSMRPWKWGME